MARMSGFFCQDKYLPKLEKLTNEEAGILFRALMKYHTDGEIPSLDGQAALAFDFIRFDIDEQEIAYQKKCEQASENRRKGIKQKSTDDNARQRPLTDDNGSDQYNITKHNIKEYNKTESSFIGDDEAAKIQREHDRIYLAAEDAGFQMSNTVRAMLVNLYAEHGLDKMLSGFNECVSHGATNLAYLEAVLKGTGKKPEKKSAKTVVAQDYEQRDYSEYQDELERRQKERFAARLGRVV